MKNEVTYQDVLTFWFEDTPENKWFEKDEAFDEQIRQRFAAVHQMASAGELWSWRDSMKGRLAEVIILDQFSRNMFRNQPEAYNYDSLALVLAQEAVSTGYLDELNTVERAFIYMPFMHSESAVIHEIAILLFQEEGMESFLYYEEEHRDIIEQFGRYPHRNEVLKRQSSKEELEFLKEHDGL